MPQLGDEVLDNNCESEPELPIVNPPFLPEVPGASGLTLVLDLDETLVHYYEDDKEGHILIRPGTDNFLKTLSEFYEIVVFTAALQDYADWVLDQIDPNKYIKYRLYRQHACTYGTTIVKDLSKLGRGLSRMIIVDNVAENFQSQPENGILIKSWVDDPEDTALPELCQLLKGIFDIKIDPKLKMWR